MAKHLMSLQNDTGNAIAVIAIFAVGTFSATGLLAWHPWDSNPYRSSHAFVSESSAAQDAGMNLMSRSAAAPSADTAGAVPADSMTTTTLAASANTPPEPPAASDTSASADSAPPLSLNGAGSGTAAR